LSAEVQAKIRAIMAKTEEALKEMYFIA